MKTDVLGNRRASPRFFVCLLAFLASGCLPGEEAREKAEQKAEFLEMIKRIASDKPTGRTLDWINCLKRIAADRSDAGRTECESWSYQGMTSTLAALRQDDYFVPVIETQIDGSDKKLGTVLHLVGGTGGQIFETNPAPPPEVIESFKSIDGAEYRGVTESPVMVFLEAGYTIASVGYWGTAFRTTDTPDEIDLAVQDVRIAWDFYENSSSAEPVLLTESLGNHIALEALGGGKLETLQNLANVPAIDGIQHMVEVYQREVPVEDRDGKFTNFNIFAERGGRYVFSERRMLSVDRVTQQFVGRKDLPLRDIRPKRACSRTILGSKDYRTRRYLKVTKELPEHIIVLNADHDVAKDAPEEERAIYQKFVDCIVSEHKAKAYGGPSPR